MSNSYLKVTIQQKRHSQNFWFSNFKKFGSRSVFGELQLTQISLKFKTSCCNLKIRGVGAKRFHYFNSEWNYKVLKWKSPCILLNKNLNFNKKEMELKMENPIHGFREMNCEKLEPMKEKTGCFLYGLFCTKFFFWNLCHISMYSALIKLSEYT